MLINRPQSTHPVPAMQRAVTPEEFFYHVFEPLPRQGPGCTGATWKAWSYLLPLPEDAQILDVGCGTGVQIQDLADISAGTITAVDNHRQFLDTITAWADGEEMGGRVRTVNASMDDLPFENGQFELIWSEGDISSVERTIPGHS